MKKFMLLFLATAMVGVGCATTETTAASTANQTITLDQALQKSVETREKLLEAKQAYENAKLAAEVVSGKKTVTQAAQQQVQNQVQTQIDTAKKQLEDEKNAWKELLK